MKQFALYYIPSDTSLYRIGTQIIGYDIIKNATTETSSDERIRIMKTLNEQSAQYGFHITLTDVVSIEDGQLNRAMERAERIFHCPLFKHIVLSQKGIQQMPHSRTLAMQFNLSPRILLLHSLLVFFVQRLGSQSQYSDVIDNFSFFQRLKIKIFFSPYIFSAFIPHLSIISNFAPSTQKDLYQCVVQNFQHVRGITLERIAVVVKESTEKYFRIVRFLYT